MEIDINDFVTFTKIKNGDYKITHDENNQANIAKYLHKMGFGITKLNSKTVLFKRENFEIYPFTFDNIKSEFYKMLDSYEYVNLPKYISCHDISNWYLQKNPIKNNEIFKHYLKDNLSEKEIHLYLLKVSYSYREEFKIQKLLLKLSELGFSEIVNHKSSFFVEGNIHYKNISENQYLLFLQYMKRNNNRFQFECYLTEYKSQNDIAIKPPNKYKEISCCFDIEKDYAEIEQYLN